MKKKDSHPLHILPDTQFVAEDEQIAFGEHFTNHRINFYAIVWFTEDQDVHYIDFEPYPIKKNVAYLLAKHQVHAIPSQTLPKAKVIVCSSEFFQALEDVQLRQLFLPFKNEGIVIPDEMITYVENLFSLLLAEFHGYADMNLLIRYPSIFLFVLSRFTENHSPMSYNNDTRIIKIIAFDRNTFHGTSAHFILC